ncbi:MAG: hypothetical protein KBS80_09420 [Bacteroidales bacterium]|nr:hypothetical protein [Candidatus Cryptobacteroides choladohippi]
MKIGKTVNSIRNMHLSMRAKLSLSLLSIAAILLISCIISYVEYSIMTNYVSGLVAEDINSINEARKLADMSNSYNLQMLAVIGDDTSASLPDFDDEYFLSHCELLRGSLASEDVRSQADSVMYSYSAYMLTSLEADNVLMSDFIDSRSWYFERLQPRFQRLQSDIDKLSNAIFADLKANSATFERGFYRSAIPGLVAVGVGILLVFMLLFFVNAYYVTPLNRMLDAMNSYRNNDKKYTYKFEGDDELLELNSGIADLASENQDLRRRITTLRSREQ